MIQRPQTLLLLAAAGAMIATLFLPIWSHQTGEFLSVELGAFSAKVLNGIQKVEITKEVNVAYIAGIGLLSALLSVFTIFKFKNRVLQMKLVMVNSIVIVSQVTCVVYLGIPAAQEIYDQNIMMGTYGVAFYLPLVAILMNMISNRLIKKDEQLVRSVDRIR